MIKEGLFLGYWPEYIPTIWRYKLCWWNNDDFEQVISLAQCMNMQWGEINLLSTGGFLTCGSKQSIEEGDRRSRMAWPSQVSLPTPFAVAWDNAAGGLRSVWLQMYKK